MLRIFYCITFLDLALRRISVTVPGMTCAPSALRSWIRYSMVPKCRDEDPDPDPLIFCLPDPDPRLFSSDPDPMGNNGYLKLFSS